MTPEDRRADVDSESPTASGAGTVFGGSPPSSNSGTFAPGELIGGRFRIVSLLGRGGMGIVYRADDLRLGQAVALKFLPAEVAARPGWRDRLLAEVRFARQVSHPHVCRVYDVDEIDGRLFLSMEHIDGEDLASLLKRIGPLSSRKVLEVAQQLCAGLAAAHKSGVLHRDLKPSNVMIDGRGYARIMDFGLAVSDGATGTDGRLWGTPAYMAPEQLNGQPASVQTDLYSLGLVLYEVCTGRPGYHGRDLARLRLEKNEVAPPAPSEIAHDVDPAINRVILKCLERDPRARPRSALDVAVALPGGDPLQAALAAGETPSPDMVAAATTHDALSPRWTWGLVAALVGLVGLTVGLGERAILTRRVPLARPPDALVERARSVIEHAGYGGSPADSAFGVTYNTRYLQYLTTSDASPRRWDRLSPDAVTFWYRESQRPLERLAFSIGVSPDVTPLDPPLEHAGDVMVLLNGEGRLVRLLVVAPGAPGTPGDAGIGRSPDSRVLDLFRDAGLNEADWARTEPAATPRVFADSRAAWQARAGAVTTAVSIESASLGGRPVEFAVLFPWDERHAHVIADILTVGPPEAARETRSRRIAAVVGIGLTAVAMFGGLILARRNLRFGRGDRRGASRLATFVTLLLGVSWVLDEHHVAGGHEWYLILGFVGRALIVGGMFWWTYVAFEPYVRRHWPSQLVSWSRLLTGQVRDPLIARDVLIGCAVGAAITCVLLVSHLTPSWMGWPAEHLATPTWRAWLGQRHALSLALLLACNALLDAFTALFLLVILRLVVKSDRIALVCCALLLATPDVLLSEHPLAAGAFFVLIYGLGLLLLMRVGLVAVIAMRFSIDVLQVFPIVPRWDAWYFGVGAAALALLATIVAMAVSVLLRSPRSSAGRLAATAGH